MPEFKKGTARWRKQFLRNFLRDCCKDIIGRAGKMPENWDGFELRQYVADFFASEVVQMSRQRKREYRNDLLTKLP